MNSSQSTGLALGSADFIHKMFLQTFVGYETSNETFGAGIGEENTYVGTTRSQYELCINNDELCI